MGSVFVTRKSRKLYVKWLTLEGKWASKTTGLDDTASNRRKVTADLQQMERSIAEQRAFLRDDNLPLDPKLVTTGLWLRKWSAELIADPHIWSGRDDATRLGL